VQVLTAGLKGRLLQGRSAGGEIWRRSATELGEVGVGVALRASRSHCQAQSVPVEALRGSGRTEAHRRRGIEVAEVFTGGEVVGEIRRVRGRIEKGWPGENSGRRGGASSRPGRSSGASGRRGSSGAEERRGGVR